MAQPYVGEIRMFAGNFPPNGWMFCEGQLLAISENETLFQLIGTTFGGDGQETFGLPDLRGRAPLHQGTSAGTTYILGETGGVEEVTLTTQQLPIHTHAMLGSTNTASGPTPTNLLIGQSTSIDAFLNAVAGDPMSPQAITPVGGNQPHENMQPYLCVDFIISLFGIFPSQT
ncbi:microcystin-dependent protein [Sphingomonas naasensis]|uniref:Phage tail protein n=1 Tax=Sphingomonas naasensis TaxID=1344951 RepID=A0A4S1WGZ2_9SPHN|nr:tail fiber protein [Sphingomonas naasensis]NIJ21937.1 microcystin-dependent protein [Sphingomonas naasensis]TGX42374.1 phage tail protein [Sphingomonas naasensis]